MAAARHGEDSGQGVIALNQALPKTIVCDSRGKSIKSSNHQNPRVSLDSILGVERQEDSNPPRASTPRVSGCSEPGRSETLFRIPLFSQKR